MFNRLSAKISAHTRGGAVGQELLKCLLEIDRNTRELIYPKPKNDFEFDDYSRPNHKDKITSEPPVFGDDEIKILCDAMVGNSSVDTLNLSFRISTVGAAYLAKLLEQNSAIRQIHFRNNQMDDEVVKIIAQGLIKRKEKHNKYNTSFAFKIDFRGNLISDEGAKAVVQMQTEYSKVNQSIKVFLNNNQIGNKGAMAIGTLLKEKNTKGLIHLSENKIGVEGIKALLNTVYNEQYNEVNFFLQVLLQDNESANNLAHCYKELVASASFPEHAIFNLSFTSCSIGLGLQNILDILFNQQEGPRLKLDLSFNHLGLEGAKVIAKFIESNPRLCGINLSCCEMSDEGFKIIAKSLEKNNTLTEISINGLDYKLTMEALLEVLKKNKTLYLFKLTLRNNGNEVDCRADVQRLLDRNRNIVLALEKKETNAAQNQNSVFSMAYFRQTIAKLAPTYHPFSAAGSYLTSYIPTTTFFSSLPGKLVASVSTNTGLSSFSIRSKKRGSQAPPRADAPQTNQENQSSVFKGTLNYLYAAGAGTIGFFSNLTTDLFSANTETNIPTHPPTYPPLSAEVIVKLTQASVHISENMALLTTLKEKQASLSASISAWEAKVSQDKIIQAELEEIAQEPEVKFYYLMMKAILERALMASVVIASKEVASQASLAELFFEGICTLAGAAFPNALPALGFIKMAAARLDSTLTYRQMLCRLRWVELAEIPEFAAMLARRLALAQKSHIVAGISRMEHSAWENIKDECRLFAEELKTGEKLSDGERRALLEAKEIFEYLLSHDKPDDMSLSGRVTLLIQHIVGTQYVYTPPGIVNNYSEQSAPIVPAYSSVARKALEKCRQEIADLKAAQEANQKSNQEQAQQLYTLQHQLAKLQRESELSNVSFDKGDGTVSMKNMIMINTTQGPVPLKTLIVWLQKQIADMQDGLATTNQVVAQLDNKQGVSTRKQDEVNTQMRKELLGGASLIV